MAEKKIYVDQNLQGQKLTDAVLLRAGMQTVANLAALNALATSLQGLVETKRVIVFREDISAFYVWDGGGATGAFVQATGGSVAGSMVFRGGLQADVVVDVGATITDGVPTTYSNIKVGHQFIFTTAGTLTADFGSPVVEVGDQLIFKGPIAGETATHAELIAGGAWTVIQNNLGAASNTTLGTVRTATATEVRDGATGAPTPSVIKSDSISARQFSQTGITLVANTAFTLTHNLNTKNVRVVITDSADEEIGLLVVHTGVNAVDITSNVGLSNVKAYITSW